MQTTVEVKTGIFSKINWTQAVSFLAMLVAYFGVDIDPQTQAAILATITGVSTIVTFVIRQWFTKSVTASSLK